MTNNNLYELPKTETISYYDVENDKNLTVEQWNQSITNSGESSVINKSGGNFKSEKALHGVYGPGWWDDHGKTITKQVASVALTISYFTPVAPLTISATIAVAGTGTAMMIAGNDAEREVAGHLLETTVGAGLGAAGAHFIPGGGNLGAKAVTVAAASCCRHCPK